MIFFDTNVILDILDESRPDHWEAWMLLSAAEQGAIRGCASSQSLIDAAYIQTQTHKVPLSEFRVDLRILADILTVLPIEEGDILSANDSPVPDYEDAAQLSCAQRNGCEMIVTRDKKFKGYTSVPTMTVRECYHKLFKE